MRHHDPVLDGFLLQIQDAFVRQGWGTYAPVPQEHPDDPADAARFELTPAGRGALNKVVGFDIEIPKVGEFYRVTMDVSRLAEVTGDGGDPGQGQRGPSDVPGTISLSGQVLPT